MNISSSEILDTITFIEGFASQCYINTHNGLKRKLCEILGADEYLENYRYESELLESDSQYNEWAEPRILGFVNALKNQDDEDIDDIDESLIKFYEDQSWIHALGNTLFRLFSIERDRAKSIILNRLLAA